MSVPVGVAVPAAEDQWACRAPGELMMLNQRDTVNVSTWNFTVRLERPGCDDGGGLTCTFLRLPDPYSSLWVLSRDRVQHFMRHRFWRCACGLSTMHGPWGFSCRPCSVARCVRCLPRPD